MRLAFAALALLALPAAAAVDGTTAERKAFAAANPKCRGSSGAALVACPPFQIVYDKPKCLGGVLTWMEISATKASARSTELAAICATPCTYEYGPWSACASSGRQTRDVIGQTPAAGLCVPTATILEQSCKYVPPAPACRSWSLSGWSSCTAGKQTREASSTRPRPCTMPSTVSLERACAMPPLPPPPLTPYEACMLQPWIDLPSAFTWGARNIRVPRDCYALKAR